MKDIIWTLIVVWLIYKVVDIFRAASSKRTFTNTSHQNNQDTGPTVHNTSKPDQDIKNAVKNHLNNEGEYIDFEEVK